MNFTTGQVVVHPHHGPATVKKVSTRTIRKEKVTYVQLDVHNSDLEVTMPENRAAEVGVRPAVDLAGVREILDVLLAPSPEQETVWSRRIKANGDRLRTGEILIIAALIRDLTRSNEEKRLAFGEMKLLRDASAPFVTELALVLSRTEDEITAMVGAAILEGVRPAIGQELATAS